MSGNEIQYLSDSLTVERVYALAQAGDGAAIDAFFTGRGEDNAVINAWVNVQRDVNNVKGDPRASALIGWRGVEFCVAKDYKLPAAMMLHNIVSFFMPNFDEGVSPADVPTILEAAQRQTILRRQIRKEGPLMWALWDEGLAHLSAGDAGQAVRFLEEGAELARKNADHDGEAWCNIFIGKTKAKYRPAEREEGLAMMQAAAAVIREVGEDWEKESVEGILGSVK